MSAKSETGMDINLDHVPLREADMSAYEIMLSESQERMLVVIHKGMEEKARAIAEKWDVPMDEIGVVTDSQNVRIQKDGKLQSNIPAVSLVLGGDCPVYTREINTPKYFEKTNISKDTLKEEYNTSDNLKEDLFKLLATPTISSKRWIYEQYDSQVRTNTINISGDAAVMRIKEIEGKGFAVSTDCNSRLVYLNPYEGGKAAVAEAARNVACTGAKPVAITNCLNFGNPYDPEVYYQFSEAIRGMGDMCRTLDTPVTGGNVSFHNESKNNAIYPTPTIGMLGVFEDIEKRMSSGFKNPGDSIAVIGGFGDNFSGSEYLKLKSGKIIGEGQNLDMEKEKSLQECILELINYGMINSAHDTAEGGIAVALCEKAISSDNVVGFSAPDLKNDSLTLFNESQSRIIVSFDKDKNQSIKELVDKYNLDYTVIGSVTDGDIKIGSSIDTDLNSVVEAYESAIPSLMKNN
jgi:phosphoribosylformylglycinamidine synthase